MADVAREQATTIAREGVRQGQVLVEEALEQVRQRLDTELEKLIGGLDRFGSQTQALVEGRPDEAPDLANALRRGAGQAQQVAGHLRQRGVEGVGADLVQFARRRPGTFLLGCAVTGFLAGRLLRARPGSADEPVGPGPRADWSSGPTSRGLGAPGGPTSGPPSGSGGLPAGGFPSSGSAPSASGAPSVPGADERTLPGDLMANAGLPPTVPAVDATPSTPPPPEGSEA
jgi:hypothetical protein